jgi:peptidoglycan/xylan/chitin deacetylase (PgdA/CDA1 family)
MHALLHMILQVADRVGLNHLFRALNARKIRVLMYHGVSADPPPVFCWTILHRERFERHMDYLRKHYSVIPASSLLGQPTLDVGNRVVITFDDGLVNTLTEARPVLKERGLSAICFVLPGLSESHTIIWADRVFQLIAAAPARKIDLSQFGLGNVAVPDNPGQKAECINNLLLAMKSMPHSKRLELINFLSVQLESSAVDAGPFALMDREQIAELAATEEFEIGPHTNNHPILSTLDEAGQREEIAGSLEALNTWGIPWTRLFAYPNGRREDFNQVSIDILQENNISHAVSTIDGLHDPADNPMTIKRVAIGADCSEVEFKARLSGLFYFIQKVLGR